MAKYKFLCDPKRQKVSDASIITKDETGLYKRILIRIFLKMSLSKTQIRIQIKNWNGTLISNRDYFEFFMKHNKNSTNQNTHTAEKGVTRLG